MSKHLNKGSEVNTNNYVSPGFSAARSLPAAPRMHFSLTADPAPKESCQGRGGWSLRSASSRREQDVGDEEEDLLTGLLSEGITCCQVGGFESRDEELQGPVCVSVHSL